MPLAYHKTLCLDFGNETCCLALYGGTRRVQTSYELPVQSSSRAVSCRHGRVLVFVWLHRMLKKTAQVMRRIRVAGGAVYQVRPIPDALSNWSHSRGCKGSVHVSFEDSITS